MRHDRAAPDEQRGHEHIRQVVGDVVELGSVEPGNALTDAEAAGEQAIGRVNDDLEPQPEERGPIVEVDDRSRSEKGENDAAGRVEMNKPSGN